METRAIEGNHSAPVAVKKSNPPKPRCKVRVVASMRKNPSPNPNPSPTLGLLAIQLALKTLEGTVKDVQESVETNNTGMHTHIEDAKKQSLNTMKAILTSLTDRIETMETERCAILDRMKEIESTNFKLRGKVLSLENKVKHIKSTTDNVSDISQQLQNLSTSVAQIQCRSDPSIDLGEITPADQLSIAAEDMTSTPAAPSSKFIADSDSVVGDVPVYNVPVRNGYAVLHGGSFDTTPRGGKATTSTDAGPSVGSRPTSNREVFLRLPNKCDHAILGSSMTKDIRPRLMDPSGRTHVRSVGGARINDLTRALDSSPTMSECQVLTLLIGSNDLCDRSAPSVSELANEYESLLESAVARFPNAIIRACSVLPRKGKLGNNYNKSITSFNDELKSRCKQTHIVFLDIQTHFVLSNGEVKTYLYNDLTHLNDKGAALLAKSMKMGYTRFQKMYSQKPVFSNSDVTKHVRPEPTGPPHARVYDAQPVPKDSSDNFMGHTGTAQSVMPCPQSVNVTAPATIPAQPVPGPMFVHPQRDAPYAYNPMVHPGPPIHMPSMNMMQQWHPQHSLNYLPFAPHGFVARHPQMTFHGGPMTVPAMQ
jgi:hypothetical protein